MPAVKQVPWLRIIAEGTVIVVSILLAFGIEAWWADRAQREAERTALGSLQNDFVGYLQRLEEVRASNLGRIEAGEALLASTGVLPTRVGEAELRALLGRVVMFHTILLQPGTQAALMEADGAALISNRTLQEELVAWTQSLESALERNAYMVEQSRALDAYLKPRYPMEAILRSARAQIFDAAPIEEIEMGGFPSDARALLKEQEFANHVSFAIDASFLLLSDVDRLEGSAKSILGWIRSELETGID